MKKSSTNDVQAREKLTRARAGLILEQPFFGTLALRLQLKEDRSCPTMWVDGRHVGYNPDFVNGMSAARTKAAMCHEVMHCVYAHIARRGSRNPRRWNVAGDYAINPILKDCGFDIGENWLYNEKYFGMSADHIYNLLPDTAGSGGDGDGEPLCDVRDGQTAEEPTEAVEREWKLATTQAAAAAKMAGKLPKSLQRFIDELVQPKVDWRALLRQFIVKQTAADYSWNRPNRRMLAQDLYLPRLWSEQMGEIVVMVDTSGSIDSPTLSSFAAEIKAIVQDTRPTKTTVIYCDAAINKVVEFEADDEIKLEMVGGGGTSFLPPFNYIREHSLEPECAVYLTDGYGPFPPEQSFPTLWVCTSDVIAPIGETIPITI